MSISTAINVYTFYLTGNVCPRKNAIFTTQQSLSTTILPSKPPSTVPPDIKLTDIRLPRTLTPLQYDLEITPYLYTGDEKNFYFNGKVGITINCKEATKIVTLHANMLKIDFATVTLTQVTPKSDVQVVKMTEDKKRQFVHFFLSDDMVKGNEYILFMEFTGPLKTDLKGFYLSSYEENGQKR